MKLYFSCPILTCVNVCEKVGSQFAVKMSDKLDFKKGRWIGGSVDLVMQYPHKVCNYVKEQQLHS